MTSKQIKEVMTFKIFNGNTRKIIWTLVCLLCSGTMVVFGLGKKTQVYLERIDSVPAIQAKLLDHDNQLMDVRVIRRDMREMKETQKLMLTIMLEQRK